MSSPEKSPTNFPNKSPEKTENVETKITFEVPLDDGEPLGATPNERMIVVKIQKGSIADKFLHVGDQLIALNEIPLKDPDHLYELLQYVDTKMRLTIKRNDKRTEDMLAKIQIPEDREKNILKRDGYSYFLATLNVTKGKKLGIGIRNLNNRVIVSKCDRGSLADEIFLPGDRICDVEGIPVSDKDVCRRLMVNYLQKDNKVTLVIERPDHEEAKKFIFRELNKTRSTDPSYKMNTDVKQIAALERQRIKAYEKPAKSILSSGPSKGSKTSKGITFENDVYEYYIVSDNEGKQLRKVKKY
uniref:PDZ domain-containing protein n=1 Tax=Parastrongyloides trichosuri TaxID=131310 RepID=A0A0N4Z6Q6_PARTI